MDYSRYTDEELRLTAIANCALTEPMFAECVKRFLAQDPRGDYQEGYDAGHDAGYDEGQADGMGCSECRE